MKIREQQDLSILHLNISSISAHINYLRNFLNFVNQKIDIICISESRISTKNPPQTTKIDLPGYNIEQTPTESSAGGALIYISQRVSCKSRKDLHIYCAKELESVFIDLLIPNKKNHLVGVIYKHPTMMQHNSNFMNTLFDKLTKENKPSVISGDFNLNLMKYTQNRGVNQFLENILSNNFIPHITLPTRVTEKSATLIDNIFTNNYEHTFVSGNTTSYISDHLPQVLIIKNLKQTPSKEIPTISFRDYKNFSDDAFKAELSELDWSLVTENSEVNLGFETFVRLVNRILDKDVPTKIIEKEENKITSKSWITRSIKTSMKMRDKFYKQMIKTKSKQQRLSKHNSYKKYRNKITALLRIRKQTYYQKYFEKNKKNSKRIWQGIHEIISSRISKKDSIISTIIVDGNTITAKRSVLLRKLFQIT